MPSASGFKPVAWSKQNPDEAQETSQTFDAHQSKRVLDSSAISGRKKLRRLLPMPTMHDLDGGPRRDDALSNATLDPPLSLEDCRTLKDSCYEIISEGESSPVIPFQSKQPRPPMSLLGASYGPRTLGLRDIMPSTPLGLPEVSQPATSQYLIMNGPTAGQLPPLPADTFARETEQGFGERGSDIPVGLNRNGFWNQGSSNCITSIASGKFTYGMVSTQAPDGGTTTPLADMSYDPSVSGKSPDKLLQNIRPDMYISKDARSEGLKQSLYRHQELAVAWMEQMEAGTTRGGILADDMGLGKTISILALILSRKPDSCLKTNLIVGPLALARQWEEEIKTKILPARSLSVFVYHNKRATSQDLLKYDVVVTTYGILAKEFKRLGNFMLENKNRKIDFDDHRVAMRFPLLNPKNARFYRVVLDEAQCIKNMRSQASLACHQLQSTYRWCLTGTPMMNGILELYPLVRFLKVKRYAHWERFRQAFGVLFGHSGDPKHKAMRDLRALLKAIMLRRKKDSMLEGQPMLQLPPKTEEVVYAVLSPDERDFYNQLERKSQVLFNKYLRANNVGKNYSSIIVLLLRLRQACCHPHLNMDVDDVSLVKDELMKSVVTALDPETVQRIKELKVSECPNCLEAVHSTVLAPCGHNSCKRCLTQVFNISTNNFDGRNEEGHFKCAACQSNFTVAECFSYEAFQKVHMPESLADRIDGIADTKCEIDEEQPKMENLEGVVRSLAEDMFFDSEDGNDKKHVQSTGANMRHGQIGQGDSKQSLHGTIAADCPQPVLVANSKTDAGQKDRHERKSKEKAAADFHKGKLSTPSFKSSTLEQLRKDSTKSRIAYQRYMAYLHQTWLPSAKVEVCLRLLRQADADGEKTIVFSQWTLLLDLIEVGMHRGGFEHTPRRYDGGMTSDQRAEAVKIFRSCNVTRVMLVSLRAGNAGLNLTAATRVIMMDPFWNPYVEMQAVDRAYRIGQQNEVRVFRILTKGTVEDRIVALKERKQEIVETALDEQETAEPRHLNAHELRYLFNGE